MANGIRAIALEATSTWWCPNCDENLLDKFTELYYSLAINLRLHAVCGLCVPGAHRSSHRGAPLDVPSGTGLLGINPA
jgi:hypothetical protein